MNPSATLFPQPAPGRRGTFRGPGWAAPMACLALLALGGCAASAPPPANTAALVQQAYASNRTIRSVSDALDQRLDLMLTIRTAEVQP